MHSCGKHKQTANDHIASYFVTSEAWDYPSLFVYPGL